jgi:hypothetical protein
MTDTPNNPDNVVPEEELARRRRVLQLTDDISDLLCDLSDRCGDLLEVEPDVTSMVRLAADKIGADKLGKIRQLVMKIVTGIALGQGRPVDFATMVADLASAGGDDEEEAPHPEDFVNTVRMAAVIDRLFAEAPKLEHADGTTDETQAPALQCHIMLRGIPRDLYGALSRTPEGTLRMLTMAMRQDPKQLNPLTRKPLEVPILCEQFFDVADVVSIMVEREVTGETSSIIA